MTTPAGAEPDVLELLRSGELHVLGRIMPASNQTFFGALGDPDGPRCVYKPVSGERPLWDFPDGTLAEREYAARVVSEHMYGAARLSVVPPTLLRGGPAGDGMVQLWQEPVATESGRDPVDVVPDGPLPAGFLHVLDATGGDDEPVMLVHEDSAALRRIAVFDLVTNNTDRKGGHVLTAPGSHRWAVDHGVCFHVEDKLRTVLWGWAGYALDDDERRVLEDVLVGLSGGALRDDLEELLRVDEVDAVARRCERLLGSGVLPTPRGGWPSIPWPPF